MGFAPNMTWSYDMPTTFFSHDNHDPIPIFGSSMSVFWTQICWLYCLTPSFIRMWVLCFVWKNWQFAWTLFFFLKQWWGWWLPLCEHLRAKLILKILNVVVNWIVSIVSNIWVLKKVAYMLLTELFLLSQHWVFFSIKIISSFQKL